MTAAVFIPIDDIKDARKRKKTRQAFYTPDSVVKLMLDTAAGFWTGARVLEPSAGDGRIVHELLTRGASVDACELDDAMRERCRGLGANIVGSDFLEYTPAEPYDFIVMNPPFQKGQAKRHIEHAYSMLSDRNSELVAIAPSSMADDFAYRTVDLPKCNYAVYERLAKDAFKESGAAVETLLVTIQRGECREVCGFRNGATANAAFTIGSDRELLGKWKSRGQSMRTFQKAIAEGGGSCYGIDWLEVVEYLPIEAEEVIPF